MTARGIWAVVPIKDFEHAKQRLAGAHAPAFRRRLATTMAGDVLAALAASPGLAGVAVVTADREVAALVRAYRARVLSEGATDGHTGAVMAAAHHLASAGCVGMLTMPGDIPGVLPADISALLAAHGAAPAFTIAPAHDRRGSNAVLCSPPDLVALAFGNDSFLPHLAKVQAMGLEPAVVELPRIGLDIDKPEDLRAFAATGWRCATRNLRAREGLLLAL